MIAAIETYVEFGFTGTTKSFRFFVPVDIESAFDTTMYMMSTIQSRNVVQMSNAVVDIANRQVIKYRNAEHLELTDSLIQMMKNTPLVDLEVVVDYIDRIGIPRPPSVISEFKNEYRFLSNFYPASFMWNNFYWVNSEAAYQSAKSDDPLEWVRFSNMLNPAEAKREGKKVTMRKDWEDVKVGIMHDIVYEKFNQNLDLKQLLLATDDAVIEEGNNWKDTFWGICPPETGIGQNHLGKILMKVRQELRSKIQF